MTAEIKTHSNKGIWLSKNGYTFSIQFGAGNYCQNRDEDSLIRYRDKPVIKSNDCEVAVFQGEEWITYKAFPEHGQHKEGAIDVIGYMPVDEAIERFVEYTKKKPAKRRAKRLYPRLVKTLAAVNRAALKSEVKNVSCR